MTLLANSSMLAAPWMFVLGGARQRTLVWSGTEITLGSTNISSKGALNTLCLAMSSIWPGLCWITSRLQRKDLLLLATRVVSGVGGQNANVWKTRRTSGFADWGLFTPPTDLTQEMKSKLDPESTLAEHLAAKLFSNLTLSVTFLSLCLYFQLHSGIFVICMIMYYHVLKLSLWPAWWRTNIYVRINAKSCEIDMWGEKSSNLFSNL